MSTSIRLGDAFMHVPKLDETSENWVTYKDRFLWSINAHGYLEHVGGTANAPSDPIVRTTPPQVLTADEKNEVEWKELKIWKQGEAIVKQQIMAAIADSQFMKIHDKATAREVWEGICRPSS